VRAEDVMTKIGSFTIWTIVALLALVLLYIGFAN
jgi:hypothetical protein